MKLRISPSLVIGVFLLLARALNSAGAESIWIEADHLDGIRGYCFPDMDQKTAGHWALSGPGIAPEWTQGGESEWLSIACSPDDDKAEASIEVELGEVQGSLRWQHLGREPGLFRLRPQSARRAD